MYLVELAQSLVDTHPQEVQLDDCSIFLSNISRLGFAAYGDDRESLL